MTTKRPKGGHARRPPSRGASRERVPRLNPNFSPSAHFRRPTVRELIRANQRFSVELSVLADQVGAMKAKNVADHELLLLSKKLEALRDCIWRSCHSIERK